MMPETNRPTRSPQIASNTAVGEDVLLERAVPAPDPLSDFFWISGRDGLLRVATCGDCGYLSHPPTSRCPRCLSLNVEPQTVSGCAVVHSFTINHQQWITGQSPYVIAVVELVEQPGMRLTTNVIGCPPEDVYIGMAVEVHFLARNGLWYPLFVPAAAPDDLDPTESRNEN